MTDQRIRDINNTAADYPRDASIHSLFDSQADSNPQRIAAVCGEESLSFGEVQRRANQLANRLTALGVRKGDLVGVCIERGLDIPVALLGILKAGAGYVPLDPEYPEDRLRYMCQNAQLKIVISHESLTRLVSTFSINTIFLDIDADKIASMPTVAQAKNIKPTRDIAYVIYTSGSTGKPKGVCVPHGAAVNMLHSLAKKPGFRASDTFLALTTLSFDISVCEIFLPLVTGGCIAIVDRETAKDGQLLIEATKRHNITVMQATPPTWRFLIEAGWQGSPDLTTFCGGEAMPRDLVRPLLERSKAVWNLYGPTETTVWSTRWQVTDPDTKTILIGKPLENTTLSIVDESLNPVPYGEEGELLIGGDGVTLGYLNRDELTRERFVTIDGHRVYRTGDLAKYTESGEIQCLGRIDSQVKLHGFRIELEEIDAVLAEHPMVRRAAAVVREDKPGDLRLIGYIIPETELILTDDIIRYASERLPEYMVPARLCLSESFPQTPSGKLDRKAFSPPSNERPDIGIEYVDPCGPMERAIADIWANVLSLDKVGIEDNFFQFGGTSILAQKAIARMREECGIKIIAPELFAHATIARVLDYCNVDSTASLPTIPNLGRGKANATLPGKQAPALDQSNNLRPTRPPQEVAGSFPPLPRTGETSKLESSRHHGTKGQWSDLTGFAIVGLAARFPGAANVTEYWQNLVDNVESIRFFTEDELDPSLPSSLTSDPSYVPARGIIDDADSFDANFFATAPREAELIDPQQRVMLEVAYHALEDAGCHPNRFDGKVGVFAGTYESTYVTDNLLTNPEVVQQTGRFQLGVYNEKDYIALRVAHKLNLTGPAINVNTACSTSLVAVIQACKSLEAGQCDAALAGAASIHFPQYSGHLHQTGSIQSPDGHCRPFDAEGAGTLFSDGAGMVVVKRHADAVRDGDRIYAVLKGLGINNDGGEKASFTAPSVEGQAAAIEMALQDGDIEPETVGYIEAHGTATSMGDPIEFTALSRVFDRTGSTAACGLGSVKSNIGHCVAAAGIAGLIKTALAMHHELIPATLHYKSPNPAIDLSNSRFNLVAQNQSWPKSDQVRRAGVSSFGVGGTNAHVVLEEPIAERTSPASAHEESTPQIFPISAKSPEAVEAIRDALGNPLARCNLADAAFTLQTTRQPHSHRAFILSPAARFESKKQISGKASRRPGELVWMFPGQGSQYLGMGHDLYEHNEAYHKAFSDCCEVINPLIDGDLKDVIFGTDSDDAKALLNQTQYTQPALFAVSYSLAQVYLDLGLRPSVMLGHSIGEFVAATIAGVFSLEDACRLIAERGRMMQALPAGSMLSVRAGFQDVQPRLTGDLTIASDNAPKLCVVAGPTEQIDAFAARLESEEIPCRKLHTSHAFHSSMMDSIVEPFAEVVRSITLNKPQIRIRSTATGDWLTDEQATDPAYWAQHLRLPVLFANAIKGVAEDNPNQTLLEIGPRKTLATLARQTLSDRSSKTRVLATLSDKSTDHAEWYALLEAIGNLWTAGYEIRWEGLHNETRHLISLPGYPFQRKRYFIEPPTSPQTKPSPVPTALEINSDVQAGPHTVLAPLQQDTIYQETSIVTQTRREQIAVAVKDLFESTSGFELDEFDDSTTFFEMGMDSLILTQTAAAIKREFSVDISFRQLLEEVTSVDDLVAALDSQLPADRYVEITESVVVEQPSEPVPQIAAPETAAQVTAVSSNVSENSASRVSAPNDAMQALFDKQLEIMRTQLAIMSQTPTPQTTIAATVLSAEPPSSKQALTTTESVPSRPTDKPKKTFGAGARVTLDATTLHADQQQSLDTFIRQYNEKTPSSKTYAQTHRAYLADPRTVSGFRPDLKEMTYPLVANRSKGSRLWDIDGNEYVDFTCGFGSNFLGHSPDFMIETLTHQTTQGYEIGPQHPLAGEVAKLFCEMTGAERMAFCNTGSEAVLGACRLARTATGRDRIVMFNDDYHGILDEVVVRSGAKQKSFPAAAGIPKAMVENVVVLPYGEDASLDYIREHLDELAAVVVEPVQSRRPELQPGQFLRDLGELLSDQETALIFDEVICGLRIAPGGAQEYFGVKADIGTYGKILGGGMPIGAIAGRSKYLDGLDGGFWQFGDDSKPEAGMTYFAGTFVRHPLALAAAYATLTYLKSEGREAYDRINGLANSMVRRINAAFEERGAPIFMANFGSLFKTHFRVEQPFSEVFFAMLRHRGVHVWDHRPCLITLAHTTEDIDFIVEAFTQTVDQMIQSGLLSGVETSHQTEAKKSTTDQMPNIEEVPEDLADALEGKDRSGNPGWFVADDANPGEYVQVR